MSPCQKINALAARLGPNLNALQIDSIRREMNEVADEVKELEMFRLEMQKDITERQARPSVSKVVPFRGKVPVYAVGDPA